VCLLVAGSLAVTPQTAPVLLDSDMPPPLVRQGASSDVLSVPKVVPQASGTGAPAVGQVGSGMVQGPQSAFGMYQRLGSDSSMSNLGLSSGPGPAQVTVETTTAKTSTAFNAAVNALANYEKAFSGSAGPVTYDLVAQAQASLEAAVSGKVGLSGAELSAYFKSQAFVSLSAAIARGEVTIASLLATASANVDAEASLSIGSSGVAAKASAFAGAKAAAAFQLLFVKITATAYAGVGASASFEFKRRSDGKLVLSAGLGVACGLGAGINFELVVPAGLVDAIKNVASDIYGNIKARVQGYKTLGTYESLPANVRATMTKQEYLDSIRDSDVHLNAAAEGSDEDSHHYKEAAQSSTESQSVAESDSDQLEDQEI